MVFSYFACLLAVLFAVAIDQSAGGCAESLQECGLKAAEGASVKNMEDACRIFRDTSDCFKAMDGQCTGQFKVAYDQAVEALKMQEKVCGGSSSGGSSGGSSSGGDESGSDGDTCGVSSLNDCFMAVASGDGTDKEKACKVYSCVKKLKDTCKNEEVMNQIKARGQTILDEGAQECGTVNLKPSLLIVMAATLLFAFRFLF